MMIVDKSNEDAGMMLPAPRVGYAYVPMQIMGETYTPEKALMQGTIFPELDLPMGTYGKQYTD